MIGGTIYGINKSVYTPDKNRCELSHEGLATSIGHYPSTVKDALSLACGACPSRPLSEKFMDLHPAVFDDSLTVKYSLNGRAASDKDKLFGIRLIPLNVEAKQSTWDVRGSGNAGDVLTEIHWLPNSQALDLSHSELNWQGPPSFNPTKFNLKPGSKWEAVLMSRCSPATAPVILDIIRFEVKDPDAVTCVDDSAPGTSLCSNLTIPNAPVIVAPIANGVQNPGVQFQFQSSDPSSHNVTTHYELWAASIRQKVWHTRFTTGVRANDTWSPTMGRTSRFTDVYTSPMWFVPKVGDEIEFQVRACADNQVNSTLPRKCSRWTKKRVIYQSPSGTPRVTVGVTKVGDGSVLFQPSGDVCDSRCSSRFQTYATGTNVTLTASPLSFFRSWDNCPSGNSNAVCTLGSVNASKSLTATFGRPCDLQKSVDIGGKTDISIGCFATRVIVKIPQYCNHRIANIKVFPWQVFDLKTQNVSAFVQRTFTSPSPQQVDSVEVTLNRAWGCRVEIQAFY